MASSSVFETKNTKPRGSSKPTLLRLPIFILSLAFSSQTETYRRRAQQRHLGDKMSWTRRGFIASTLAFSAKPSFAETTVVRTPGYPWVVTLPNAPSGVALTFDDGPHPDHTPRLLDILGNEGVKATFFLIGRSVAAYPQIARQIVEQGHEVGNHTWNHPFLAEMPFASVLSEIDRTNRIIEDTTGKSPHVFRPPYGSFTGRQSARLAVERGMTTVFWSVDPHDWRRPGPDEVARRILQMARPGSIILTHDIHWGTVAAMPATIAGLRARNLATTLVSPTLA